MEYRAGVRNRPPQAGTTQAGDPLPGSGAVVYEQVEQLPSPRKRCDDCGFVMAHRQVLAEVQSSGAMVWLCDGCARAYGLSIIGKYEKGG